MLGLHADRAPDRLIAWLINFGVLPRHARHTWAAELDRRRCRYSDRKKGLLTGPDGRLPQIFEPFGEGTQPGGSSSRQPPLDVHNPLSLADDNPWQAHFQRLEAFEQIGKDVERAFPDEQQRFAPSQRDAKRFQRHLTGILAVWSLLEENLSIGYRQGMHEIGAVCWLVVKEGGEDGSDLEADTFTVFEAIMHRSSAFYAWQLSAAVATAASPSTLPILQRCSVVQESLLANDSSLHRFLETNRIAVQLFTVRWLRLLFLRELQLNTTVGLWDALFDVDPSLHLLDHLCVALLIRMRDKLMSDGQTTTGALQVLMGGAHDEFVQPGQSVHDLVQEARQAHRRFTAVRSGYAKVEDANTSYGRPSVASGPPLPSFNIQTAATALLGSRAPAGVINAQTLGAGFSRALDSVQRTAYAAYQSHMQPRDAGAQDGFPPSMDGLPYANGASSRSMRRGSDDSFVRLSRTPFAFTADRRGSVTPSVSPSMQLDRKQDTPSADPLGADKL